MLDPVAEDFARRGDMVPKLARYPLYPPVHSSRSSSQLPLQLTAQAHSVSVSLSLCLSLAGMGSFASSCGMEVLGVVLLLAGHRAVEFRTATRETSHEETNEHVTELLYL